MKYTLARFTVKPEHIKETRRALADLIAAVRKDQPRTLYAAFKTETPGTFVALICFQNEAAERRYAQSEYVSDFAKKILPWCDGKPLFRELEMFGATRRQWLLAAEPFAAEPFPGVPAAAKRAILPKQVALRKLGQRKAGTAR